MSTPSLQHKQVFIFDWDGTLFDSMGIKTENFCAILTAHLTHRSTATMADIRALFTSFSGLPRYDIFRHIAAHYGITLSPDELNCMSAALTAANTQRLADAPLFPDALPFLEYLIHHGKTLYVSSSVPLPELEAILARTLPPEMLQKFSGIFGTEPGFTKGPGHIARILAQTGAQPDDCIIFGDDEADVELSRQAGVECLRIQRSALATDAHIASFNEVMTWPKH